MRDLGSAQRQPWRQAFVWLGRTAETSPSGRGSGGGWAAAEQLDARGSRLTLAYLRAAARQQSLRSGPPAQFRNLSGRGWPG